MKKKTTKKTANINRHKKKTTRRSSPAKAVVSQLVSDIVEEIQIPTRGGLVTIAVPAEEKDGTPIPTQSFWTKQVLQVLADYFRGASAFHLHTGIYKHGKGEYQYEKTIYVQAFAQRHILSQETTIRGLVEFCLRMRKELNQDSILLAIDTTAFFIDESL